MNQPHRSQDLRRTVPSAVPPSSPESLVALLEAERECCAQLVPLVEREVQATATRSLERLLECTRDREQVQARWLRLAEQRRRELAARGVSLVELSRGSGRLAEVARSLSHEAGRLRSGQRVCEAVVRGALRNVTDLLNLVRQRLPDSRYDAHAAVRSSASVAAGRAWTV